MIVLQTATYCHECFQSNFESKVRQNLEQGRLCTYLHRNEEASSSRYPCQGRVAIGFSGGAASRALLHIASERLSNARRSKGNGKMQEVHAIDVIYIDTSAVVEGAQDETEAVRLMVQEEGGEADRIHFWPLKLHDVYDDDQMVECTSETACECRLGFLCAVPYLFVDSAAVSLDRDQVNDRQGGCPSIFVRKHPTSGHSKGCVG
jgi:hypothetical protein